MSGATEDTGERKLYPKCDPGCSAGDGRCSACKQTGRPRSQRCPPHLRTRPYNTPQSCVCEPLPQMHVRVIA